MMKCEDAVAFVDSWEKGRNEFSGFEDFKTHLASCPKCSRRFGAVLPFIARDAADAPAFAGESAPDRAPLRGFTDKIMSKISAERKRTFYLNPIIAAAAAAAILAFGVGFGLWFGSRNSDTTTVKFVLYAPQANSVQLAGDFNSWNSKGFELDPSSPSGTWTLSVPLKKGKVYVYNFIIDGKTWIPDPRVPAKVDDGFGGSSSLLRL